MTLKESISSAQNPKIRKLLNLQEKSHLRKSEGLFVVEGVREVRHCLENGYDADTLFICRDIYEKVDPKEKLPWELIEKANRIIEIPDTLYEKVAQRGGSEGIIAEIQCREHRLDQLNLPANALVMVLEKLEKPGNLGAILRSADGAGADAVILCNTLTDLYNPNIIRSSLGSVFTVPTAICSSEDAIEFLKQKKIQILTAQLQDSSFYYDTDMRRATAIVIGSEAEGLSDAWREAADRHVLIPMNGKMDSLNASVSAAILLYEAVKQRTITGKNN